MKYCIDYNIKNKYVNQADEININWREHSNFVTLKDFLDEIKDKVPRINICVIDDLVTDEFINQMTILRQEYNIYLNIGCVDVPRILEYDFDKLAEIPYYFDYYIKSWDVLIGMLELGVSDIYITEELGFALDHVRAIVNPYETQIRAFPDICQSSWSAIASLYKFFIRPEDVDSYEGLIDVLEFYETENPLRQEALYEIYAIKHTWLGDLKDLITDFYGDVHNPCIIPDFKHRVTCGRRCMKDRPCHICGNCIEIAEILHRNKLYITPKDDEK